MAERSDIKALMRAIQGAEYHVFLSYNSPLSPMNFECNFFAMKLPGVS